MKKLIIFVLLLIATTAYCQLPYSRTDIYVSGTEGYHTFRIPSLITTSTDTLLAFCEGRVNGIADTGDIDVVLKRSSDSGLTWSALQIIYGDGDAVNSFGNPTVVVDTTTGFVWLTVRWVDAEHGLPREQRQYITHSEDDGVTWADTTDITTDVTLFDNYVSGWDWFAPGPGVGIQCDSERLLMPFYFRTIDSDSLYAYTVFSDDNGTTWEMGGYAGASGENLEEWQAVELLDGTIMLNARTASGNYRRAIATSEDEGETWSAVTFHPQLFEPVVMGSFIRFDANRLIFTCPVDTTVRKHLTLKVSYDEGETWTWSKLLKYSYAGYSCLSMLPDGNIGCLYENGVASFREKLTFASFSIDWVEAIPTEASGSKVVFPVRPPYRRAGRK